MDDTIYKTSYDGKKVPVEECPMLKLAPKPR
jgi:hypothetical protein